MLWVLMLLPEKPSQLILNRIVYLTSYYYCILTVSALSGAPIRYPSNRIECWLHDTHGQTYALLETVDRCNGLWQVLACRKSWLPCRRCCNHALLYGRLQREKSPRSWNVSGCFFKMTGVPFTAPSSMWRVTFRMNPSYSKTYDIIIVGGKLYSHPWIASVPQTCYR